MASVLIAITGIYCLQIDPSSTVTAHTNSFPPISIHNTSYIFVCRWPWNQSDPSRHKYVPGVSELQILHIFPCKPYDLSVIRFYLKGSFN